MDSFRKQLGNRELQSDTKAIKEVVDRLQELSDKIRKHASNNDSSLGIIDDGVLLGKIESCIRLLSSEIYRG